MNKKDQIFVPKNFIDITGQTVNGFFVIEQVKIPNKNKESYWRVKCHKCPQEFITSKSNLKVIKQCLQCSRKNNGEKVARILRKGSGVSTINTLYGNYKSRALRLKIDFLLTKEEFINFIFDLCFYCGRKGTQFCYRNNDYRCIKYNGIDRKNTFGGYTLSNCVTCCKTCNYGKSMLPYEEWMLYLNDLVKYRNNLNVG